MNGSSSVLFANQVISTVSQGRIVELKQIALNSPLKRSRLCLHLSHEDLVQEMVIVLHKDTYLRPHRHQNKTESFHMIEGAVCICFFEDSGEIKQLLLLSASPGKTFLYRLSDSFWHTVIPLTEYAVFHEVATGPFSSSEFPSWEPQHLEAIDAFKDQIRKSL
jgi:cupin fold WbuC family metalloprotein